jgi:hypothetical protein
MPSASEILAGLERVARDFFVFAVLWHGLVAAFLGALASGWWPSRRTYAALLALPLLSVSLFSWSGDGNFNGLVFAALAAIAGLLGASAPVGAVELGSRWARGLGGTLVGFAWIYPHFLPSGQPWAYLYGAPMGLVPCATLALVLGLALIGGLPGGLSWSLVLAGGALFYGAFGLAYLGVLIDAMLLFGAVALVAEALHSGQLWRPHRRHA